MSGFTPGPWEVEGSIYQGIKAAVSGGEPRRTIAQVPAFEDARLIANAPDLLEALEKARRRICSLLCMTHEILSTSHHPDCSDARAAISKARGDGA